MKILILALLIEIAMYIVVTPLLIISAMCRIERRIAHIKVKYEEILW